MNYADALLLWQKALGLLRESMNETRYRTWFEGLKLHSAENGRIVVYCDDAFIVRNIRERYKTQLSMVIGEAFGEAYDLEVVTSDELSRFEKEMTSSPLNPKYTFETFVVGNGNRMAFNASMAVAEAPANAYNPLFIYGGVGLGKTHLMNAISHFIVKENPKSRILFTTSENFTNEVVEAIARKKTMELRNRMRSVDVLLIDDVQFLSNKQATQEEFFHTFNALHDAGKQIILSSDRPPKEVEKLEERLRSRFEWGLITDIQAPDLETRIAILRKKAMVDQIDVPNDVMFSIANRIDTNIRELEGALTRVVAYASLTKQPVTTELVAEALKDLFPAGGEREVTLEIIQEIVASYFQIPVDDLHSKKRSRSIAFPRQIAMYLCRELTESSLPSIGQFFGGRDHTTVLHAYDKIKTEKETDDKLAKILTELVARIQKM